MNTDWNEFYKTMTWAELIQEYEEALQRMRRYIDAHPEGVPPDLALTFQRLSLLYDHVKRASSQSALLDQHAPVEAVKIILGAVGQVRREVPFTEQSGHA